MNLVEFYAENEKSKILANKDGAGLLLATKQNSSTDTMIRAAVLFYQLLQRVPAMRLLHSKSWE